MCGHEIKMSGTVIVFGKETSFVLNNPNSTYCMECYAKMAIRCAWCGGTIMVGDPITLYTPIKQDFQIPDYAIVYEKDPLQLVGCLGWECADSGMDRSGFWIEPGEVQRVASPMEMLLATDDVIICSDLSDISKAVRMPPEE